MSNHPEGRRRLTGADVLAASLAALQEDTAGRELDEAIIGALQLRPRPGLYVDHDDRRENLLVLEEPSDPEDSGADAIIGLALPDGRGSWYLSCITCHGEIEEADAGMCQPCREDAAWQDEQQRAAQDQAEDW